MPNWNFIGEARLEWESGKVALEEKRCRLGSASCSVSRSVLSSEFPRILEWVGFERTLKVI